MRTIDNKTADQLLKEINASGSIHDAEFTANAGREYGTVKTYTLVNNYTLVVVDHGDGNSYPEIADQVSLCAPPHYLLDAYEYPNLEVGVALTLGLDHVDAYEGDGSCRILRYRSCYSPNPDRADIVSDERGEDLVFVSINEAKEWIEAEESAQSYVASGQHATDYVVIE